MFRLVLVESPGDLLGVVAHGPHLDFELRPRHGRGGGFVPSGGEEAERAREFLAKGRHLIVRVVQVALERLSGFFHPRAFPGLSLERSLQVALLLAKPP